MSFMHFDALSVAAGNDVVTLTGTLGAPNTATHSTTGTAIAGWLYGVADSGSSPSIVEKGSAHRVTGITYFIPDSEQWTNNKSYVRSYWIRARHDPGASGDPLWGVVPTGGNALDSWIALSGTDVEWRWVRTTNGTTAGTVEVSIATDAGGTAIIATGYYKGSATQTAGGGGGGGGCFTGNMRILMADGTQKLIAEIREGEMVVQLDEDNNFVPAKVNRVMAPRTCNVYELKLSNGKVIETTAEHTFRTVDGKWMNIDPEATYQPTLGGRSVKPNTDGKLQPGTKLYGFENNAEILKIVDTGRTETVYHLSNVGEHSNYFVEGICVHNVEQVEKE